MFRALTLPVALHGAGIGLDAAEGWKLGVPRDHHSSFDAGRLLLVALVFFWTAVVSISTAHGLERSERGSATFTSQTFWFSSSSFTSRGVKNTRAAIPRTFMTLMRSHQ